MYELRPGRGRNRGRRLARAAPGRSPRAPVASVSQPGQREVTEFIDFTGRTDTVNTENIVPRVTGHLVRMPFKERVLGIDRAVGSEQGLKYVYMVDAQNKAQCRRITTGSLLPDGLRVVTAGLKPGEWVAVGALQQIRPNMQGEVEQIPVPSVDQPTAARNKGAPP